jgi:hypothetical protein
MPLAQTLLIYGLLAQAPQISNFAMCEIASMALAPTDRITHPGARLSNAATSTKKGHTEHVC